MRAAAASAPPECGPAVFNGWAVRVGACFPEVTLERLAVAVDDAGDIIRVVGVDGDGSGSSGAEVCVAALAARGYAAPSIVRLTETQLLMPGLIDGHVHAPQYAYVGLGTDCALMGPEGWLERHAFPAERRLAAEAGRARAVFTACVDRLLDAGTTTALYFATQSAEVSAVLAAVCAAAGQRAFVGRVAMDRNCPESYADASAEAGASSSEASLNSISDRYGPLVQGALTPRFVPTCSRELLRQLGRIAEQHPEVVVQSHISESVDQVAFTKVVEGKDSARDAEIFDACELLRAPAVMAHAVLLQPAEIDLLARRGCAIAHCPLSNAYFANVQLDVMDVLRRGCRVCLGTDVAGGYSPSMLSAMRQAVVASRVMRNSSVSESLDWRGALWLATAGGAAALGLASRCGRLEEGYAFDALLVDAEPAAGSASSGAARSPYEARELVAGGDMEPPVLPPEALLERFVNLGDDRNLAAVYVAGRRVAGTAPSGPATSTRPERSRSRSATRQSGAKKSSDTARHSVG